MLVLEILFYSFILVVLLEIIIYVFIYGRFAFLKAQKIIPNNLQPVSVIVCAKNEEENLKAHLSSLINQSYPNFELVLVNDSSNDNTLEVMEDFAQHHQNVKIVDVKEVETFWGNKKYALTLGIKAAKNELLLFTDADCKPVSNHWIAEMVSQLQGETVIVLGYGAYNKVKNSFLNKLIRFETLLAALRYFSFAKLGSAYMGVGRNLAYTKSSFFKANGFMSHMRIKSGDDDLFVNQVATSKNTTICFTKTSFTTSVPKLIFKTWMDQKRRHISTSKYYQNKHKIALAGLYSLQILFWILGILLIALNHMLLPVLAIIGTRLLFLYIVFGSTCKKLNDKDVVLLIPILEICLIITHLYIFIHNLISKPYHWK